MNDKKFALDIIKLLSAVETYSFLPHARFPDHLYTEIARVVEILTTEVIG